MITKEDSSFGVHAAHCCSVHGCKYREDDVCPVVNGLHEGVYCEDCYYDEQSVAQAITLLVEREFIPEGFDPSTHDLVSVPKEKTK